MGTKREKLELYVQLQGYSLTGHYGFMLQGFGIGRATEVASVRSCEQFPPCPIEPVSANSKTDLLLAKAKPISDGGSTSGITYLRRGRKNCSKTAVVREE